MKYNFFIFSLILSITVPLFTYSIFKIDLLGPWDLELFLKIAVVLRVLVEDWGHVVARWQVQVSIWTTHLSPSNPSWHRTPARVLLVVALYIFASQIRYCEWGPLKWLCKSKRRKPISKEGVSLWKKYKKVKGIQCLAIHFYGPLGTRRVPGVIQEHGIC